MFIDASEHFKFDFRKFCAWVEYRNIRRVWGFDQSSQNALLFEIKTIKMVTVVKRWIYEDFMCCHVKCDSEAPITWRRWLRQIYAWVEYRNSRWVCWQKFSTKALAIFENKPMQLVTFRNGVLTWFWPKTALAQIQISECSIEYSFEH